MTHPFSAIAKTNDEIFERLDSLDDCFKTIRYRVEQKDEFYQVHEQVDMLEVIDIVYEWRCHHEFVPIPELFQNTPSHLVKNFEDLKIFHEKLNKVLLSAFEFMGDVLNTMPILNAFKVNFEMVNTCLNEIEKKIEDLRNSLKKGSELLPYYRKEVENLNSVIKTLRANNLVTFGDGHVTGKFIWKTAANEIKISEDGLTCSKSGSCSYSVVASDMGWKMGVHVWWIRADQISCYDTIGICDESFFGQTKPLLVGFGTYPGSHRSQDGKGIKYIGTTIMGVGTTVKCTLDLSRGWEFTVQVEGKEETQSVSLEDHFTRGTKLYPAMNLCNASKYTIVEKKKTH